MEFSPTALEALVISVTAGLIILLIQFLSRSFVRSSVISDIKMLELEKERLESMKRSSVEMNRVGFRSVFAVLMMISIAEAIPHFAMFVRSQSTAYESLLSLFFWSGAGAMCFKFFRRYEDVKELKPAVQRIDGKIEKLSKRLK